MQRLTMFLLTLVLSVGTMLNNPSSTMAEAQAVDDNDAWNVQFVGHISDVGFAWDVATANKYAYIASSGNGIDVFDVSEPSLPRKVGGYANSPRYSTAVIVSGAYAFISEGNLRTLSLADPAAPTELGFYQTVPSYTRNLSTSTPVMPLVRQ